jgi:hypothetical protein
MGFTASWLDAKAENDPKARQTAKFRQRFVIIFG